VPKILLGTHSIIEPEVILFGTRVLSIITETNLPSPKRPSEINLSPAVLDPIDTNLNVIVSISVCSSGADKTVPSSP
jgi:hypothetical protein